MYLASIMAAAPASLRRDKELGRTVAATVPRKPRQTKEGEKETKGKRRVSDIFALCTQARSSTYGALTR